MHKNRVFQKILCTDISIIIKMWGILLQDSETILALAIGGLNGLPNVACKPPYVRAFAARV